MKVYCAYAFTGEDLELTILRMKIVVDALNENGHEAYCNRFDPVIADMQKNNDTRAIFARAFEVISECDALVALVASSAKSIGQIMEIGAAMSQGKPVYLFEHATAVGSTYLPKLATATYLWADHDELVSQLKKL